MTRWLKTLATVALPFVVGACNAAPAVTAPTEPPIQAPTVPLASTPTPETACPEPTEGTKLLRNDDYGYCLLIPEGYTPVNPLAGEVCLVPGDPGVMACHSASAFIEVADAAGRTADQVADQAIADAGPGLEIQRESLVVAGEPAVTLEGLPGVVSARWIGFVHDDRLYTLSFGLPDEADPASVERFELRYNTVIDSFTLLPVAPPPAPTLPASGDVGSAVVAYVKEGNVLVWEEATGQSQTAFDPGDVVRVEMSDDGRMLAFVRVSAGGEGEALNSSLWVAESSGANARELTSDAELRALVGASPTDNVGFHCVEWIPNGHRLVSIGGGGHPRDQGECVGSRLGALLLFDADTGDRVAPPGSTPTVGGVLPSPDGADLAVMTSDGIRLDGLYFLDVDASPYAAAVSLRPVAGPVGARPGGLRGWSQDSSALFVQGPEGSSVNGFIVWRVPADGSPPEPVLSTIGSEDRLAPDGTQMSVRRAGEPFVVPQVWYFIPFPVEQGAIASLPVPGYMGFSWSPGGGLYRHDSEALVPLCAGASQVVETCQPSISFGEAVTSVEWMDSSRFVYVTSLPRRLMLGSLDGWSTVIAEDPQDPAQYAYVASTCRDDSEFVADVTVPDGTHVAPSDALQKTWRIRNTGDCAWDDSYRLTFLSGDRLSGPRSAPLGATVEPGQEVDVSAMLLAPAEAGTYQGYWQLFSPDGRPFGTGMYVLIDVP